MVLSQVPRSSVVNFILSRIVVTVVVGISFVKVMIPPSNLSYSWIKSWPNAGEDCPGTSEMLGLGLGMWCESILSE